MARSRPSASGAVRARKVCKYPDEAVYNGTGSTDDAANFHCRIHREVPRDFAAAALTNKDVPRARHGEDRHEL